MATNIYYGNDQVDYDQLLTNAANSVNEYVNNKPWSNKRKEKFINAYTDIINSGILGASNNSGQWAIDINRDFDLSSLPKKDQEMYQEAAYFIRNQMSTLPTITTENIEPKQLFDNKYFTEQLQGYIGNQLFGGQDNYADLWNARDSFGENGLRNTINRQKDLANMLKSYRDSLKEGDFNFEGSPFANLEDLKQRITTAATLLETKPLDQETINALNSIGIDHRIYFDDGSQDIMQLPNGNTLTREQYNQLLQQQKTPTVTEEPEMKTKKVTIPGVYAQFTSPKLIGTSRQNLAEKYQGNTQSLLTQISGYLSKGIINLNGQEQSELLGAYRYGATSDISNEELNKIKRLPSYANASRMSPSRFKKFKEIPNTYYDTLVNHVFQLQDKNTFREQQDITKDFLKNYTKADQRQQYLKGKDPGITNAEWEELAAIGFDLASIVDPEPFSAAGLALTGSGLRNHAKATQPGGMNTSDIIWQGVDYLMSVASAVPLLGDAALVARVANNVRKVVRPLGYVLSTTGILANAPQAAQAAWNKIVNGQDLTIEDWRHFGGLLTSALAFRNLKRTGDIAKSVTKQEGQVQVNVEGQQKTISGLKEETAKQLKKDFRKAGNNNEKKTEILRSNEDVKEQARLQGIELEKASIVSPKSSRNGKITSGKYNPLSIVRTSGDVVSTKTTPISEEEITTLLNSIRNRRSSPLRFRNASAKAYERQWRLAGGTNTPVVESQSPSENQPKLLQYVPTSNQNEPIILQYAPTSNQDIVIPSVPVRQAYQTPSTTVKRGTLPPLRTLLTQQTSSNLSALQTPGLVSSGERSLTVIPKQTTALQRVSPQSTSVIRGSNNATKQVSTKKLRDVDRLRRFNRRNGPLTEGEPKFNLSDNSGKLQFRLNGKLQTITFNKTPNGYSFTIGGKNSQQTKAYENLSEFKEAVAKWEKELIRENRVHGTNIKQIANMLKKMDAFKLHKHGGTLDTTIENFLKTK